MASFLPPEPDLDGLGADREDLREPPLREDDVLRLLLFRDDGAAAGLRLLLLLGVGVLAEVPPPLRADPPLAELPVFFRTEDMVMQVLNVCNACVMCCFGTTQQQHDLSSRHLGMDHNITTVIFTRAISTVRLKVSQYECTV